MAFRQKQLFLVVLFLQVVAMAIYLMSGDNSLIYTNFMFLNIFDRCGNVHQYTSGIGDRFFSTKSEFFQPIDGKEAWLYSAFYDHVAAEKGNPLVRVFGVVRKACALGISCTFTSDGTTLMTFGVIKLLPGEHGVDYPPSYLECPLPSNERPTHISISFQIGWKPTNRVQIIYPGPRIRNFTVCYSVLHSGYDNLTQLIESIEMNRILGAEHFMVYNYSISPAVDQILRRYQEDGLVTVLQWQIPTLESWYFAQMTALNDCFYRNRNISRFVVVVDTDELIVPRLKNTWMELIHSASPQETDVSQFINSLGSSNKGHHQTECFIVKSSFFYINSTPKWDTLTSTFSFTDDEKNNIIKYKILTLLNTERENHIFPHKVRSKYIARPELIYISGVHEVHETTNSKNCLHVNDTLALTHHYRQPDSHIQPVNDLSAFKFKQTLYPRFMEQIKWFHKLFL